MVVKPPPVQQLLVSPLLDDLAVVDHQHVVCIADGAQAVGDRHPITPALLPSRTKILVDAQGPRNPAEDSA